MKLVRDKGNEFRICRLALRITDCVSEEPLQGVQVASVPGNFDCVANGSFYTGRCGLEGLCHLGVQYLGDGVDGVPTAHPTATAATGFVDDL